MFSVVLNPSLGPHFSIANAFQNTPPFLPQIYSCLEIQHLTLFQQPKILHNNYINFAKSTSTRCDGNGMLEVGFIYWVLGYLRRDEWLHCVWVNMNGASKSFVWFNEGVVRRRQANIGVQLTIPQELLRLYQKNVNGHHCYHLSIHVYKLQT